MMAVTCALMMCAAAFGAVMPQLPEPVYDDAEVCTNENMHNNEKTKP